MDSNRCRWADVHNLRLENQFVERALKILKMVAQSQRRTKWRFRKSPRLGVGQDRMHVEVAEARRPRHYLGQVRREFRRRGIALLFHCLFIRMELNYRYVSSGAIAVLRDR